MVSLNSTELNVIAYDWDKDGKAEVVLRGADDMIIHMADGTTRTVGVAGKSYRSDINSHNDKVFAWTHTGPKYLLNLNGETAKPYTMMTYPLKRLEAGETEYNAWVYGQIPHTATDHRNTSSGLLSSMGERQASSCLKAYTSQMAKNNSKINVRPPPNPRRTSRTSRTSPPPKKTPPQKKQ